MDPNFSKNPHLFISLSILIPFIFSLTACSLRPQDTSANLIEGTVWYRERMATPPDAVVRVTLEEVSRMDMKSTLIAETNFAAQNSPPWSFRLAYDPEKLNERGRYVLRAQMKSQGRLLFTSTETIPAFANSPVNIMMSRVPSRTYQAETAIQPNASLFNTYWKLTDLMGEKAPLGINDKEVHLVLNSENVSVSGFSGCNSFTGSYAVNDNEIKFSQMASTMRACIQGMETEQEFLKALSSTRFFKIVGDDLTLFDQNDRLLLRFKAVYLY
ncbi:MAG: YbaY family lipoprotein [Desulfuromonadales bacterium]